MKAYIKENFKLILAITVMLFASCALIVSNEIRAQILPVASEELTVIYCEIDKEVCEYTGNPIKNDIHRIVFDDQEGNHIVKYRDDFKIIDYIDNVEIGQADIEISINGYQDTIIIEDAFTIQPPKGIKPQITNATRTFTDLMWEEVIGADGYLLYKSKDNGQSYMPIKDAKSGKALVYTDKDVALNEVYLYYVRAYKQLETGYVFGESSEPIKIYTPLDNPTITEVKNAAHRTLRVEWAIVEGAAGYQVYRSDKQDGEYTLLAEIADGMAMSYDDATCECGKPYYYYIKACQQTDTETLWGEASAIVSGRTTPEKVSLRGATSEKETKVTLTWKKVNGAQGYEVFKDGNLVAKLENPDTLTWSETGLSKDVEVSYKVRAYCLYNNEVVYGIDSANFVKEVIVITNYSAIVSGDLSSVLQYQGVPYIGGGTSPRGWDCSGFTQWVMKNYYGVNIPKSAAEQGRGGKTISVSDRASWQPGDIICYTYGKGNKTVRHVALYLGNGKMIHALSEKHDTIVHDVDFYEKWDTKTNLYTVKRYY